jgi:hypothetical protein
MTGNASNQDAKKAAGAVRAALRRPNPPSLAGSVAT